ncbi:MAG TPA: Gfo/Idh/MocA family oxidoreductase [Thermohalobaculum sp.]|nr:Gfo/Idh/MocA family oxidoreductase [Thermohalobaculum sp.]
MVRLLILGTGFMAGNHAKAFSEQDGCEVVAAADIDRTGLAAFQQKYGIERGFADIDDALAWGGFDAVANVTPDPVHHPTTMRLIEAGKHVFCEKPLAVNANDAYEMADAIEAAGLVGMVNLSYRNASAIQQARTLVAEGRIGAVRHVEASYLQSWLVGNYWGDWRDTPTFLWRLSEAHGSKGVLGDVGIHIADFASYGADSEIASVSCNLQTFAKAEGDRIGEYVLDANDSAVMNVSYKNGAIGVIHATRFATGYANRLALQVFGTEGAIRVDLDRSATELEICEGADIHTQAWKPIDCGKVATNYVRFVDAVTRGKTVEPSFRRAADLQRVLDTCFESDRTGRRITL